MNMQEFWDGLAKTGEWGAHYEGGANLATYNFYTRRKSVMRLLEGDGKFERALDVGCGTGDYIEVADAHDSSYFGIDFAHTMLVKGKERVPGHGEKHLLMTGSGECLPYRDKSFDLVMAMGYIEYFTDPDGAMKEIKRVMKPGGTLVMQSFKWEFFGSLGRRVVHPLGGKAKNMVDPNFKLPTTWVDKKYSKRELDELLASHGYARRNYEFNNFFVLPGRFRKKWPQLYIRLSEAITHSVRNMAGFLAANYIGKYVLEAAD